MKKIDEVKKLIENGFDDLELIAFELDIPIEQVKQCKADIESNKQKATSQNSNKEQSIVKPDTKKRKTIDSDFKEENYKAHVKMKKMKEKFDELVYGKKKQDEKDEKDEKASEKPKQLSPKEIEKINMSIVIIEGKIQEVKDAGRNRIRKSEIGREIVAQFKKIDGYQLSMEQAEKIYTLINSRELDRLRARHDDLIDNAIALVRRKTTTQFVQAIELKLAESNDIQELQALSKLITEKMAREGQIFVGGIKSSISNKIMKLQQKQRIEKIRNDIPMNIASVIQELVAGKIDIQVANGLIDEEAKKRVDSGPKTKFALSADAQKRQILMQIKTVLAERGTTYAIQDTETVIRQLQELCGIGQEEAVRIVVKNCIGRKDYKIARSVCDRNEIKNEYGFTVKSIASLRDEINHAEFGDIVLEGINNTRTQVEEKAYIDMIEKALNSGKIRTTGVKLGKSVDGLRDVTLADIWEEGRGKQVRSR